MKSLRKFFKAGAVLAAGVLLLSFGFVSCSNDDDESGSSPASSSATKTDTETKDSGTTDTTKTDTETEKSLDEYEILLSSVPSTVSFGDILTGEDGNKYAVVSAYLSGNLIKYDSTQTLNNGLSDSVNEILEDYSADAEFVKSYLEEGKITEYLQLCEISDTSPSATTQNFKIVDKDGRYAARYKFTDNSKYGNYELRVYNSDISKKKYAGKRYNYTSGGKADFSNETLNQKSFEKDYHLINGNKNSSYKWKADFSDGEPYYISYILKSPASQKEQYSITLRKIPRFQINAKGTSGSDTSNENRCNDLQIYGGSSSLSIRANLYSDGTSATLGTSHLASTGETTKYTAVYLDFNSSEDAVSSASTSARAAATSETNNLLDMEVTVYDGATYDGKTFSYSKYLVGKDDDEFTITLREAIEKYLSDYIKITDETKEVTVDGTIYTAPVLYARANFNKTYTEFYNKDFLDVKIYPFVTDSGYLSYRADDIPYETLEKVTMWSDDTLPEHVKKYSEAFESVCAGTYTKTSENFN